MPATRARLRAELDAPAAVLRDPSAEWRLEIHGSPDGGQTWRLLVGTTDRGAAVRSETTWLSCRGKAIDGWLIKAIAFPVSKGLDLGVRVREAV